MSRTLSAEEELVWQRVAATVKAYRPGVASAAAGAAGEPAAAAAAEPHGAPSREGVGAVKARPVPAAAPRPRAGRAETLDASWDRRLASGKVRPDRVLDLHGMQRAAARAALRAAVHTAAAGGERLLLVITGKGDLPGPAPADLMAGAAARGAIRAELPRWLGEPDMSPLIAAVRQASPAHGGLGAVWLVLKRRRAA